MNKNTSAVFVLLLALLVIVQFSDFASARKINRRGLNLVKKFEGWRSCKYRDPAGLWTIGYGHLIKRGERFPKCISKSRGENVLKKDLGTAERCVTGAVKRKINSNQFSALASFTFNLGCGNLRSSTLLKRVNARKFGQVCKELRRWVYAGGRVLPGLKRRRNAECKLFHA